MSVIAKLVKQLSKNRSKTTVRAGVKSTGQIKHTTKGPKKRKKSKSKGLARMFGRTGAISPGSKGKGKSFNKNLGS